MFESHPDPGTGASEVAEAEGGEGAVQATTVVRRAAAAKLDPDDPSTWGRISRNAPCPCGAGRKYKHCHGKAA